MYKIIRMGVFSRIPEHWFYIFIQKMVGIHSIIFYLNIFQVQLLEVTEVSGSMIVSPVEYFSGFCWLVNRVLDWGRKESRVELDLPQAFSRPQIHPPLKLDLSHINTLTRYIHYTIKGLESLFCSDHRSSHFHSFNNYSTSQCVKFDSSHQILLIQTTYIDKRNQIPKVWMLVFAAGLLCATCRISF